MIVAAANGKICIWPGSVLPPLMVYLRKQPVPEKLKDGLFLTHFLLTVTG